MRALLSIKPEFAEKILSGEKQFEYRKVGFTRKISHVVIYVTSPVCKIVGEFEVSKILESSPQELWEKTKVAAGISSDFFFQYYAGRSSGVALQICATKRYKNAIDPYKTWANFYPPQSFRYWPY